MLRASLVAATTVLIGWIGAGTAAAATFLVDEDRAQCPSAPYRTIQSAIDAAGPDDDVVVCYGTYRERVFIPYTKPGLVLEAQQRRLAKIVAPKQFDFPQTVLRAIVVANANRNVVRGFRILGPLPNDVGCSLTFNHKVGIQIGGFASRIEDNQIYDIRDNCGEGSGIWSGDAQGELSHEVEVGAGAGSVIADNRIEQYRRAGVIVETSEYTPVQIVGNEIIGAESRSQTVGVQAAQEGRVVVEDNLIGSNQRAGVLLNGAYSGEHVVRNNRIRASGIGVDETFGYGGSLIAGNDISASRSHGILIGEILAETTVANNLVRDNVGTGIRYESGTGGLVEGNQVLRNRQGGIFFDSGYAVIRDNVALDNLRLDCRDAGPLGGPGTLGTFNTWTNNRGRTSSPAGLCTP